MVMGYEAVNLPLEQLKLQAAKDAAYQAYLDERMRLVDAPMNELQKDRLALEKAQQAWNQTYQTAGLTGYFEGSPTLAREQMENQNALAALQLSANLRGPRNAFQQQAVMSGLNAAGLSKAVDAVTGAVPLPSFQAPQAAPQAATLGTLAEDLRMAGGFQAPGAAGPGAQAASPVSTSPATYATASGQPTGQRDHAGRMPGDEGYDDPALKAAAQQAAGQGYTALNTYATDSPVGSVSNPTDGSWAVNVGGAGGNGSWMATYADEATARARAAAMQPQQPAPASTNPAAYATPSGQPTGGASTSATAYAAALPTPNKIVSKNWLTLPTDTREFLTGAYEAAGWSANDINDIIRRTLPQFRAPTSVGAVRA